MVKLLAGTMMKKSLAVVSAALLLFSAPAAARGAGDESGMPKEVRGYKVERREIKVKGAEGGDDAPPLVTFGEVRLVGVGPLETTLEVQVTVAPVGHAGQVERLVFEGVSINGVSAEVDDYEQGFALPKDAPVTLPAPLRVRLSSAGALLGVVGELLDPREVWPVRGRVYVCGRYRRFLMSFKRAVPVEIDTYIKNPT